MGVTVPTAIAADETGTTTATTAAHLIFGKRLSMPVTTKASRKVETIGITADGLIFATRAHTKGPQQTIAQDLATVGSINGTIAKVTKMVTTMVSTVTETTPW